MRARTKLTATVLWVIRTFLGLIEQLNVFGNRFKVKEHLPSFLGNTENVQDYQYLAFMAEQDGEFITNRNDAFSFSSVMRMLYFIPVDEYNRIEGKDVSLADNEILLYSNRRAEHGRFSCLLSQQRFILHLPLDSSP